MRALRTIWTWFVKALRLGFILMLVVIPIPVANLFAKILDPARKNLPAEILKKS